MKKQKSASFWVAIALILCLISSLGASMVQTGGGAIKYHDITMVTDSGHELDALLLVPKTPPERTPLRRSLPAMAGTTTVRCRTSTMLSTLAEAMWSSPSVCTVTATLRSSRTAHGLTPRTTPTVFTMP